MTSLAVLIPTAGRDTLSRCLESCIDAGLQKNDLVVVVGDTYERDRLDAIDSIIQMLQPLTGVCNTLAMVHDAGHHCWGHCQLNAALDWLVAAPETCSYVTANDDDDIYTPGAFARMRAMADDLKTAKPMLFRFTSWYGPVFWDVEGVAAENHIGGHCAVFPINERLGRFTCRYQGDYDYIRSTLDNYGGDHTAEWVDHVIAQARPAVVTRERVPA